MIRFLSITQILTLHEDIINASGGSYGIRDITALESSISQPHATYNSKELYTDLVSKVASLGFSLVMNHPFIDGNKRIGHAAMEVFLVLNGYEIECPTEEQEKVILNLASGNLSREYFTMWVRSNIVNKTL